MKAQFVNEKIERGKKPFGIESSEGQKQVLKTLKEMGIRLHFSWDTEGEQIPRLVKNMGIIMPYLKLLHKVGVDYKDMEISHWDSVSVIPWKIYSGNHVIAHCLTEKDAKLVLDVLTRFTETRGDWKMEKEDSTLGGINLHWDKDVWIHDNPEKANQWYVNKTLDFDFVKNLENSRKKYNVK